MNCSHSPLPHFLGEGFLSQVSGSGQAPAICPWTDVTVSSVFVTCAHSPGRATPQVPPAHTEVVLRNRVTDKKEGCDWLV